MGEKVEDSSGRSVEHPGKNGSILVWLAQLDICNGSSTTQERISVIRAGTHSCVPGVGMSAVCNIQDIPQREMNLK